MIISEKQILKLMHFCSIVSSPRRHLYDEEGEIMQELLDEIHNQQNADFFDLRTSEPI
jgi:hypothetical protein